MEQANIVPNAQWFLVVWGVYIGHKTQKPREDLANVSAGYYREMSSKCMCVFSVFVSSI
jgi:hypothetical protein